MENVDMGEARMIITSNRVSIVLSNQCPLAPFHVKCPAHNAAPLEVLPGRIVRDIIDTLSGHGYAGGIAWHAYNEPMMDPRLFSFIAYTRKRLPDSNIIIWTSGAYLTDELADELIEVGVRMCYITAYSQKEHERLGAICSRINAGWRLFHSFTQAGAPELDDRMNAAEAVPEDKRLACNAPLVDITIWPSGDVGLCCYDWRREKVFGSLRDMGFGEFLAEHYAEMKSLTVQNRRREHPLPVCQRCERRR